MEDHKFACPCCPEPIVCEDEHQPEPGDATMCSSCGSWAVFADPTTLRTPTEAELEEIGRDPTCQYRKSAWERLGKNRRTADHIVEWAIRTKDVDKLRVAMMACIRGASFDFSYFERQLRRDGSEVFLVAMPPQLRPEDHSIAGPKGPESYWLWIGMNGQDERDAKLADAGATPEENLANLVDCGVLLDKNDQMVNGAGARRSALH